MKFSKVPVENLLSLERTVSPDTVANLKSKGFEVDHSPGLGLAQVAAIVNNGGWLQGASEGRIAAGLGGVAGLNRLREWSRYDH